MRCVDLEEKLIDYSEELLVGAERATVESHLRDCVACQQEVNLLKLSWQSLDTWKPVEPSPILRARVWEEIRLHPQPRTALVGSRFAWFYKALRGSSLGLVSLASAMFCCFHLSLLQVSPRTPVSYPVTRVSDHTLSPLGLAASASQGPVAEPEDSSVTLDLPLGDVDVLPDPIEAHLEDYHHSTMGTVSHTLMEGTHQALLETLEDS